PALRPDSGRNRARAVIRPFDVLRLPSRMDQQPAAPNRQRGCKIHGVITLRNYRGRDFDELWRIDQECFQAGIPYSRPELAWYISRSRAFTLVAEDLGEQKNPREKKKSRIAGFVVAESDPSGLGHILTIDVRPAHQRSKVGSRLLEAAEARLRKER